MRHVPISLHHDERRLHAVDRGCLQCTSWVPTSENLGDYSIQMVTSRIRMTYQSVTYRLEYRITLEYRVKCIVQQDEKHMSPPYWSRLRLVCIYIYIYTRIWWGCHKDGAQLIDFGFLLSKQTSSPNSVLSSHHMRAESIRVDPS